MKNPSGLKITRTHRDLRPMKSRFPSEIIPRFGDKLFAFRKHFTNGDFYVGIRVLQLGTRQPSGKIGPCAKIGRTDRTIGSSVEVKSTWSEISESVTSATIRSAKIESAKIEPAKIKSAKIKPAKIKPARRLYQQSYKIGHCKM